MWSYQRGGQIGWVFVRLISLNRNSIKRTRQTQTALFKHYVGLTLSVLSGSTSWSNHRTKSLRENEMFLRFRVIQQESVYLRHMKNRELHICEESTGAYFSYNFFFHGKYLS